MTAARRSAHTVRVRRTIGTALRERPPREGDEGAWIKEATPAIREAVAALNDTYRGRADYTTTNNTPAVAWTSDDLPGDASWCVKAEVLARASDGTTAFYWVLGAFKRVASAACAQIGSTANLVTPLEDAGAWAVALAPASNGVTLTVTGGAALTVDWQVKVKVSEL